MSDGDVLTLISFYEANPCLYDVTNAEYRNKIKKCQLETEIAQILQKTGKVCMYIHQAVNAGSRGRSRDYSEIARHGLSPTTWRFSAPVTGVWARSPQRGPWGRPPCGG